MISLSATTEEGYRSLVQSGSVYGLQWIMCNAFDMNL